MKCTLRILGLTTLLLFGAGHVPVSAEDSANAPAARTERRRAAAAELAALAPHIEALKREMAAGRSVNAELERLLQRAQQLASLLDKLDSEQRPGLGRHPVLPDAQELRERADALRDRMDRLVAALTEVDQRLLEGRQRAELQAQLEEVGGPGDLFAESASRRSLTGSAPLSNGPKGYEADGANTTDRSTPTTTGTQAVSVSTVNVPGFHGDTSSRGSQTIGDSLAELRQKQADLTAALAALRNQIEALEIEAKSADSNR